MALCGASEANGTSVEKRRTEKNDIVDSLGLRTAHEGVWTAGYQNITALGMSSKRSRRGGNENEGWAEVATDKDASNLQRDCLHNWLCNGRKDWKTKRSCEIILENRRSGLTNSVTVERFGVAW